MEIVLFVPLMLSAIPFALLAVLVPAWLVQQLAERISRDRGAPRVPSPQRLLRDVRVANLPGSPT